MLSEDHQRHLPQLSANDELRVSLDVESVLADTHTYFLETYNEEFGTVYERSDIDGWDWVRTEVDWDDFDRIMDSGWRHAWDEISVTEPGLDETVATIASNPAVHLDVVTARTRVEEQMEKWLSHHGITEYNSFISTTQSKAELGYDFYIDDRPGLATDLDAKQTQYLVRGPHNETALNHDRTIPVKSVHDAVTHLLSAVLGDSTHPE